MFLRRKSRDRVIGLMGAYAVLITGVIYTRSIDSAPVAMPPAEAAPDRPRPTRADDGLSSRQQRSDIVC
jgi:hypothetical protein